MHLKGSRVIADPKRKPDQDDGDSDKRRRQEEALDEALKNTLSGVRPGFSRAADDERARPSFLTPFIQRAQYRPKGPEIIKFFQANEVLRRETGYHTCPLGADVAAAARIPPPRPSALCRGCARAGHGGEGQ